MAWVCVSSLHAVTAPSASPTALSILRGSVCVNHPCRECFIGLPVFHFNTLNGAYCGPAGAPTQSPVEQLKSRSGVAFFRGWWLSGCLCCAELPSCRRTRVCGHAGPVLHGVFSLEDTGTYQASIPPEASHSFSSTMPRATSSYYTHRLIQQYF